MHLIFILLSILSVLGTIAVFKRPDPAPNSVEATKKNQIVGGVALTVLFISIAYATSGGDTGSTPNTPQATVSPSPAPAPQPESNVATQTPAKEEWEPIGKYSKAEIASVSAFIGKMFQHVKQMDAIEHRATQAMRTGYRNLDQESIYRAITSYHADTLDEADKIALLEAPDIQNDQARFAISDALLALKKANKLERERAETFAELLSGSTDGENVAKRAEKLNLERQMSVVSMAKVFIAYLSYGFTSDMIEEKTYRLKPNAHPDRDEKK